MKTCPSCATEMSDDRGHCGRCSQSLVDRFLRLADRVKQKQQTATSVPEVADELERNPTLELIELDTSMAKLLNRCADDRLQSRDVVGMWNDPLSGSTRLKALSAADLLALRSIDPSVRLPPGLEADKPPQNMGDAVREAVKQGLLIPSRRMLRRDASSYVNGCAKPANLVYVNTFTIQWHITHACELHCKHCYMDRRTARGLTRQRGEAILDSLDSFCRDRHVRGHVCFTGGNPMLSPLFFDLYAAAVKRGFGTSILGMPTTRENIARLVAIRRPDLYQVSLEGLEELNDSIRGQGFFRKVWDFLPLLREYGVYSAVMLTLMKDNLDQVLPLADRLQGRVDTFTFNRLCPSGAGANLLPPPKEAYVRFLADYVKATRTNRILSYKDNLLNIVLDREGQGYFGGCTGYGCGAAFNFFAVLPNGETHACRKFPSPIGNVMRQSVGEVYDSDAAEAYRRGTAACDGCRLRSVCGGCMATLHGVGKNVFKDADPYCFFEGAPTKTPVTPRSNSAPTWLDRDETAAPTARAQGR